MRGLTTLMQIHVRPIEIIFVQMSRIQLFVKMSIKHNLDACIAVVKETIQERILSDYTDLIEY